MIDGNSGMFECSLQVDLSINIGFSKKEKSRVLKSRYHRRGLDNWFRN